MRRSATGDAGWRSAGREVRLQPRAALALALALHELATNAIKYGALSTATGAVDLAGRWRRRAARGST